MSDGVLSLDSVMESGNGSDVSSGNNSDSDSDDSALKSAVEAIGGNVDHALDYVQEHGNEDDLIEFAGSLASDEDLWQQQEEYRRMNDVHRIIRNWLRSADPEFTVYTGEFYGDSDDPEPGCYNHEQQKSREMGGNLMWYRAIFPEPVTEYWDSDPVLWYEFDSVGYSDADQDSHIYVTQDFVKSYSPFAREIDGSERPCPPSNDQLENSTTDGSAINTDDDAADADDLTEISGIGANFEQKLNDVGIYTREGLASASTSDLAEEVGGASVDMVAQWQEQVSDEVEQDDSDSGAEQSSLADFDADKVEKLVDAGFSKDEVLEMLG
jgi:hypothetical protein